MDLGRELVAFGLRESMRPLVEAGINRDWLMDNKDLSHLGILGDDHTGPYRKLLDYWDKHRKSPTLDIFRKEYPEDSYPLPDSSLTADELIEQFDADRRAYLAAILVDDLGELLDKGEVDELVRMMDEASRIMRHTHTSSSLMVQWNSPDYDVKGRIARKIERGIPTGIPGFDDQEGFYGFQKSWLACLLGRAKAGKTSFGLLSALAAWRLHKRVMFVSFEIAAGRSPDEPGVTDRLDSIGAQIDMLAYMQGRLEKNDTFKGKHDVDKLLKFRAAMDSTPFHIIQPRGRYTLTDLEADMDRYEPDVVYIDGFYFMTDRITGKRGSDWEAHDHLAEELKSLAMERMIPVVISHQVREKQLTGKKGKGIDDGAMMGGTGIIMAADIVLGIDVDDEHVRTLSCTRSRLMYLETVYGKWDWDTCTFNEQAKPFDEGEFATGKEEKTDDRAEPPPWEPYRGGGRATAVARAAS